MSTRDKWVRRFAVDNTARHKNGFTIYKITSVLFLIESPEAMTVVSVWKRYSDVQLLHKSMRSLHAGLHLPGNFPPLPKHSYFKRFQQEVIEERAKSIKTVLEFVAEHRLLFTSTDFVNFLQTGYPEPEPRGGVIDAIRSALRLPPEEAPPLELPSDDEAPGSPARAVATPQHVTTDGNSTQNMDNDNIDLDVSQIPIYEAADVEIRESPKTEQKISNSDSFESLNSLDSINSDLFEELSKVTIENKKPCVKSKTMLPDLINFDAPSTSKFEDYHTMPRGGNLDSDTASLSSNLYSSSEVDSRRSSSRVSLYSKSVLSLSNVESKARMEDSYVFEAGYMLNLAARCEDIGDYHRAFECYKSGIEKMLVGVQTDTDLQRRALIKEKTNKYLSYAEQIYKNHMCDTETNLLPERDDNISRSLHCPLPLSMLKHPYENLSLYRVLAVLGSSMMLVLHKNEQTCYAMKVIQKIPRNLTEFDEYFRQRTNETRQPILPTSVPYMVTLHSYIETNNLIFLILSYAPGEKLFDYIKNYAKSIPNTPAREVNLENVFSEPLKQKHIDIQNDNIDNINQTNLMEGPNTTVSDKIEENIETERVNNNLTEDIDIKTDNMDNIEISVNELVINSQRLLLNVDRALTDVPKISKDDIVDIDDVRVEIVDKSYPLKDDEMMKRDNEKRSVRTSIIIRSPRPSDILPPSSVCKWSAELLTAIESLHNTGVICRDLNPTNILLGNRGQIILTYFISYPGLEMSLSKVENRIKSGAIDMYIAPEIYGNTFIDTERDEQMDKLCDYWSFGAIMYELLCGVPLSSYHRSIFTSHTILHLPDGLPLEVESLLTQLLTYEPSERLGAGRDGIEEIKRHPYFRHIDWQQVYDNWLVPD